MFAQAPVPDAGGQREREDQVGGGAQWAPQDPQEKQAARQVSNITYFDSWIRLHFDL